MIKSKPKLIILKTAVAALGVIAVIGGTPTANAILSPLPINTPETPGVPVPSTTPVVGGFNNPVDLPAGSILTTLSVGPVLSNTARFQLSVVEIVYKETATGNLDFIFQVTNTAGPAGADSIKRVTIVGFGTFTTAVEFDARAAFTALPSDPLMGRNPGTAAPQTADRDITGAVVGFDFPENILPALDRSIKSGESSKFFVVATNAKLFTNGVLVAIDGGVAAVAVLVPLTVPIPEPSTYLFGVAVGAVMAIGYLRRRSELAQHHLIRG